MTAVETIQNIGIPTRHEHPYGLGFPANNTLWWEVKPVREIAPQPAAEGATVILPSLGGVQLLAYGRVTHEGISLTVNEPVGTRIPAAMLTSNNGDHHKIIMPLRSMGGHALGTYSGPINVDDFTLALLNQDELYDLHESDESIKQARQHCFDELVKLTDTQVRVAEPIRLTANTETTVIVPSLQQLIEEQTFAGEKADVQISCITLPGIRRNLFTTSYVLEKEKPDQPPRYEKDAFKVVAGQESGMGHVFLMVSVSDDYKPPGTDTPVRRTRRIGIQLPVQVSGQPL